MATPQFPLLLSHKNGRSNLAAVGRTGDGKSSSLNTILKACEGHPVEFRSVGGVNSVTKKCDERTVRIFGLSVRLIDTMGLFDTEYTAEQRQQASIFDSSDITDDHKVVLLELAKVMALCSDGIDAFLFVIHGASRFTLEARQTLQIIVRYFGTSMLEHCIFLLTNKDNAAFSVPSMKHQVNKYLASMGCRPAEDHQFVAFDNQTQPADPKQVQLLFASVEMVLKQSGGPYLNVAFEAANKKLEEEKAKMAAERQAQLTDVIQKKTEQITMAFEKQKQEAMQKIAENEAKMEQMGVENAIERAEGMLVIQQLKAQMERQERSAMEEIVKATAEAEAKYKDELNELVRSMEAKSAESARENAAAIEALQSQLAAVRAGGLNQPWWQAMAKDLCSIQ